MEQKDKRTTFYVVYSSACIFILFNLDTILHSWLNTGGDSINTLCKTIFLIFVLCIPLWIANDLKNKDEK